MPIQTPSPLAQELIRGIKVGDTRSLAKAITLLESRNEDKKTRGNEVLASLQSKNPATSRKIAFTGPPGAGKSTLIETIGLALATQGYTIAVITIDPSSPISGGSLLADKTRMPRLSNCSKAFIRPSSSGKGHLGGITPATLDVINLIEAAGYDFILVETIGIGQNEIDIKDLVDQLILVLPPTAGDELQGLKKGITEVVDLIAVNKHDDLLKKPAELTAMQYESALNATTNYKVPVILCSARQGTGILEIIEFMQSYKVTLQERQQKLLHLLERVAPQEMLLALMRNKKIQQLIGQQKLAIEQQSSSLKRSISVLVTYLESCLERDSK